MVKSIYMFLQIPLLLKATADDENVTPAYMYQEINSIRIHYKYKIQCY